MRERRAAWFAQFADVTLDRLVFIDEFGATTNMTRSRARGPLGKRVVCKTPHGHWKVLSTIAAMTTAGVLTACTFDAATDTEIFVAFVERFLVPNLRPGHVVVMDNLSPHRSPRVAALIGSAGATLLLLPPYSPDYNPIEMAISKVKALLRKLGKRTVDDLHDAIGDGLRSVSSHDAAAFMRHCGYNATNG